MLRDETMRVQLTAGLLLFPRVPIPTSIARDIGWSTQYALWLHVGEGQSVQLAAEPELPGIYSSPIQ